MDSLLIVVTMFVTLYTVFAPSITGETRHIKRGLLLLLAIGAFAFVLHVLRLVWPWFVL